MKPILNQSGQEGYGNYVTHKSYNPATGEHTLGLTEDQIMAGYAPTLADYGIMSNPGSSAAFKAHYIDPVKAKIEQGFSRAPDGSLIKTDDKSLTVRRFMDQVSPDLDNLSSDGTTLDNLSDAPIEMQKFIAWKQQEARQKGEVYNLGSLKADYMTEVQKYTMFDPNTTIKSATKADKAAVAADQQGSGLLDAMTQKGDKNNIDLNTEFAEGGLEAVAKAAGYTNRVDEFMELLLPSSDTEAVVARDEALKKKIRDRVVAQNKTKTSTTEFEIVDGVKKAKAISSLTDAQINNRVEEEFKRTSKLLDKAYELKVSAFTDLKNEGKISQEAYIDEHGDIILGETAQKNLDEALVKSVDTDLTQILNDLTSNLTEETYNEFAQKYPELAKAIPFSGDPNRRAIPSSPRQSLINVESDAHRDKIIKELDKIKSIPFVGIVDASDPRAQNVSTAGDIFRNANKKSQLEVEKRHDPRAEINQAVDAGMKEYYGNREYYNNELLLFDKDAVGDNKFTNEQHHLLASAAVQKSREAGQLYINGKAVNFDEMEDLLKEEKGILGEDRDFSNLVFNPRTVEIDYRADENGNFKVFATGKFEKQVKAKSGEGTVTVEDETVKSYQVDITDQFVSMLQDSEKARLMYTDAIVDKSMTLVPGSDTGESIFINDKQREVATEILGGDTYMTQNDDKTFNITGKIPTFNRETGELEIIDLDANSNEAAKFSNIPASDLNRVATEIATSISYLNDKNAVFTTPQQQAAIQADPSVKNANEVDSYNMGMFQLNTKNNDTFEQQQRIGFAEVGSEFIPIETMSPQRQIEYASKLFVNGGGGWNQWDVTEKDTDGNFKDPNFKKAVDVFKSMSMSDRNNPSKITTALNNAFKSSSVDQQTVNNVLSQFNVNMLRGSAQLKNNTYNASAISRQEGINDALVALAVMAADSGFNSNAIEVVPK